MTNNTAGHSGPTKFSAGGKKTNNVLYVNEAPQTGVFKNA